MTPEIGRLDPWWPQLCMWRRLPQVSITFTNSPETIRRKRARGAICWWKAWVAGAFGMKGPSRVGAKEQQ